MDIKSFILKLPQRLGGVPPGTDKIIEILSQHPKLRAVFTEIYLFDKIFRDLFFIEKPYFEIIF
jgi:hypothetical protein